MIKIYVQRIGSQSGEHLIQEIPEEMMIKDCHMDLEKLIQSVYNLGRRDERDEINSDLIQLMNRRR
ncbi:hypothetical protein EVB97_127 [Rhizobium phage RHph_Y65]|uniref:Uncharacterized protein n=1 Tax=Rhizobium phage RHph_Y65 TaxID=2509785 RepID=A0A7S5RDE7_9CAUD|nr:hypothetical protein PQC17_gp127 [Rhizobium phage RHph_Y65]QIG72685.1 hypothetical protein EVB97_127 [Rhizobium phage RHph_Y65]